MIGRTYAEMLLESESLARMLQKLSAEETPSVETLIDWFGEDKISKNDLEALRTDGFDPKKNLIDQDRMKELSSKVADSLKKQKASVEREFTDMFSQDVLENPEKALQAYPKAILDSMLSKENVRQIDKAYEESMKTKKPSEADAKAEMTSAQMKGLCRILYVIYGNALQDKYSSVFEKAEVPDARSYDIPPLDDRNKAIKDISNLCMEPLEDMVGLIERGNATPAELNKVESRMRSILSRRNQKVQNLNDNQRNFISSLAGAFDSILDDSKFLQFVEDREDIDWLKSESFRRTGSRLFERRWNRR